MNDLLILQYFNRGIDEMMRKLELIKAVKDVFDEVIPLPCHCLL